jgi:hypothetical protein
MSMRFVATDMTRPCTVCSKTRLGGYIDAGPVDILCLECGRAVVAAMAQARRAKARAEGDEDDVGESEQ